MIALVMFTRRRDIMGEFANGRWTSTAAIVGTVVIVLLNVVLLLQTFGVEITGWGDLMGRAGCGRFAKYKFPTPPSICSSAPTIKADSSAARNTAALASSSAAHAADRHQRADIVAQCLLIRFRQPQLTQRRGFGRAGAEAVDANAARVQLTGQRSGQRQQAGFAGGIGAALRQADMGADRTAQDHRRRVGQQRQQRTDQKKRPLQVDVH